MSTIKNIFVSFLCGIAFAIPAVVAASFPDVSPSQWFYQDVANMVEWGVIKGNDDGTFAPDRNVNRAELSAMWNRYEDHVIARIKKEMGCDISKGFGAERNYVYPILRALGYNPEDYGSGSINPITSSFEYACPF